MSKTVLILGQTGRFGRHATQAFAEAGWFTRGFDRNRDDLVKAAQDVDVIVNAWNPPYPSWASQVPSLHAEVRRAAKAANATVIVPGNVYVFGPQTPLPWSENSPHNAINPLGVIRKQMEAAYKADDVKTIVLRAGDFLDTEPSGNWFDRMMVPSLPKGRLIYPGKPDIPHAWAFLPDLVRAAVALAEKREDLPRFADVPFAGFNWSGREIADQLSGIAGRRIAVRKLNWLPLRLSRPFWRMGRCLLEMRYLWNTPHTLDGTLFDRLLPGFKSTAEEEALRAATAHLKY